MLDIKEVQALYNANAVVLAQHFLDRIAKRGITFADVKSAVAYGEIIEQYPDDYPHPSALISGNAVGKRPLHVVLGVGGGFVWLITAYHPDLREWDNDYKTRKVES